MNNYIAIKPIKELIKKNNPDSLALCLVKYVDPRKNNGFNAKEYYFNHLKTIKLNLKRIDTWWNFIHSIPKNRIFYFQLQSQKLLINTAAVITGKFGVCIDYYGIPYIPGSAVKGCARSVAIKELRNASEANKAELLSTIALVFGWSEADWTKNETLSDFYWGCNKNDEILSDAASLIMEKIIGKHNKQLIQEIPNFAGTVSFLDAYPIPLKFYPSNYNTYNSYHHRDFPQYPHPVTRNHIFSFCLIPSPKRILVDALTKSIGWLKKGLEDHAIGAKKKNGYGKFIDCTEKVKRMINKTTR
ncbi:hypothetical protein IT6_02695 [Methylacidiphilum caldifontis]|uniref:RAMP superfamily CRISPR-associated protein n=1 Tax=Methylacidiphilum caldifontis TaxID=2795386 RepID=UPI001A8CA30A|nr:RAMP superfamily CRISPR-associated protein [Methylacidiphilum caldifontis]QSR89211.1 hypothetical protein IT6_02695 [Methylacidiphilum caldifontis]